MVVSIEQMLMTKSLCSENKHFVSIKAKIWWTLPVEGFEYGSSQGGMDVKGILNFNKATLSESAMYLPH